MRLYNTDHQPVVVDHAKPAVQPGEAHDFTDEQIAAGVAGSWSSEPPREATKAELLDQAETAGIDVPPRATKAEIRELLDHVVDVTQAPETADSEPAQPDDDKEQA